MEEHAGAVGESLPLWTVSSFVLLLLSIAVLPLVAEHWWERNRNKGIVAAILALPVAGMFLAQGHYAPLLHEANEYFSFIVLIGALFVVSGGIYIGGDLRATPLNNTLILAFGGVLANIFGTTGASMVLIRPLLRTNRQRLRIGHVPIFFIFIVSNVGGCLLPVGDPPLFMGFLRGVPFFWSLGLFPEWLTLMVLLLGLFYVVDRHFWRKEDAAAKGADAATAVPLHIEGKLNILYIFAVLVCVVWVDAPYRELLMIGVALLSLKTTSDANREKNAFSYAPIVEVAVLFAGIFITMIPALLILEARGGALGVREPWQFFWITGMLSAFLDNTPTYLTYFSMAQGLAESQGLAQEVAGMPDHILSAISTGAVFMGALTYIGNGPNFMVKVICENQRVKMPSFFGYMLWSFSILLPLFLLVTVLFF